jgi:hypothetical protein
MAEEKKEEIKTTEKRDRKGFIWKYRRFIIAAAVIIILLIAGIIAWILISENAPKFTLNGYTFEKIPFGNISVYETNITIIQRNQPFVYSFRFRTDPRKLEKIPADISNFTMSKNGYFTFTPETLDCSGDALVGTFQVGQFLKAFGRNYTAAVTQNFSNNTLPDIKTCNDAKKTSSVIFLKPFSTQTKIHLDENNPNCVILEAKDCQVIEISERLILTILEKYRKPGKFSGLLENFSMYSTNIG